MKVSHYWSISIEPGWVQSAIWLIDENVGKASVISYSNPVHWDSSDEELVEAADASLSSAVQKLDEDIEPTKAVFGLLPSWIKDGQISPEHLGKVKKLCQELSLEPYGFVVLPEALAYHIKSTEGSPLNGLMIGLGSESIDVSYFKLGNLAGSVNVARSVNLADDVIEALARFASNEPFPSRFLIYDGKSGELEDARQTLTGYDWLGAGDHIKFLHTPKIEIIDPATKIIAVSLAGASETGSITSIEVNVPDEDLDTGNEKQGLIGDINIEDGGEAEPVIDDEQIENVQEGVLSPEDVGFAVGEIGPTQEIQDNKYDNSSQKDKPRQNPFNLLFAKIGSIVQKSSGIIKRRSSASFNAGSGVNQSKRKRMLGVVIFALLIGGLGFLAIYVPKSTVTVYVAPMQIDETHDITFDTSVSEVDVDSKIIPAREVKKEVSGEKSRSTSGRKTIGDKAAGTVEIRNGTTDSVRLSAGTTLTADNGLKFILDDSASVSGKTSPTNPGTEEVSVAAADIGSEYNLSSGATFSVSNYPKSEVDAIASADFSGGSSQEIASVSEEDLADLEEALADELGKQGLEEIRNTLAEDEVLVEESVTKAIGSKKFSNKVGDEATTLKLNGSTTVTALIVSRQDLRQYAHKALEGKSKEGYVLREDQVEVDFDNVDISDGTVAAKASFSANLLPAIDPSRVAGEIAGKSSAQAEDYLSSIPGFVRATASINPRLPGPLGTLPRFSQHIEVVVAAQRS